MKADPKVSKKSAAPRKRGIGSHQSANIGTDEWLTPPEIIRALGEFDLDPCAAKNQPWRTAENHFTIDDDGLAQFWNGRVWLNPPYGNRVGKWLWRLRLHQNGIALIFARTETAHWFDHIWADASAILFIKGRLHFHSANGIRASANCGGPSALIAYDSTDFQNANALARSGIEGRLIALRRQPNESAYA